MAFTPPKSAEPFLLKRRDLDIEQYNREPWRQASWTFPSVMLSGEDWPRVRQFALDTYMQMRQLYPEQFKNKTVMDWETALVNFFTTRRPDFRAQVLSQLKARYGEGKPMDPDLVLAKAVEGFGKSASGSQVKKFVEENLKKDLDFVITMEKKGYLVVEKSLPASKVKEIRSGQFGPFSIEEKDKDWGDFFRMRVPPDREAAFIKFLKDNLKGKGWYADSMGTTNKVVFPGRVFTVNSAEESTKAKAFGRGLGIPTGQLDFDKDLKKKASDIFMDEVLKCAGGPVQRMAERGSVAAMGADPAAAKGATPRRLGYAPFPGAKR